jgi:hypothetical protein
MNIYMYKLNRFVYIFVKFWRLIVKLLTWDCKVTYMSP